MSKLEILLMGGVLVSGLNIFWKWSKSLLVIVLVEAATALIMAMLFYWSGSFMFFIILIFSFFVSEALILLSSLYSVVRISGETYSSLILV